MYSSHFTPTSQKKQLWICQNVIFPHLSVQLWSLTLAQSKSVFASSVLHGYLNKAEEGWETTGLPVTLQQWGCVETKPCKRNKQLKTKKNIVGQMTPWHIANTVGGQGCTPLKVYLNGQSIFIACNGAPQEKKNSYSKHILKHSGPPSVCYEIYKK